jgi:polar amino acid transport system substrate-binding protein
LLSHFIAAIGFCALTSTAVAGQLSDIMQRKELRCGTFADVPPFAAPDPKTREMVGFDVDLCKAIAKRRDVTPKVNPLSVEARVPEVKLGRVDITVANLAYTLGRAEQIQFSDPYYLAKEMLVVKASDPGISKADFSGKRLASTNGSTSELAIKLNESNPLTFVDTGSAYMAVQQNKAVGMVANTMTITKLVNESKTAGQPLKMIEEPMVLQPIGIGMKGHAAQSAEIHAAALTASARLLIFHLSRSSPTLIARSKPSVTTSTKRSERWASMRICG